MRCLMHLNAAGTPHNNRSLWPSIHGKTLPKQTQQAIRARTTEKDAYPTSCERHVHNRNGQPWQRRMRPVRNGTVQSMSWLGNWPITYSPETAGSARRNPTVLQHDRAIWQHIQTWV